MYAYKFTTVREFKGVLSPISKFSIKNGATKIYGPPSMRNDKIRLVHAQWNPKYIRSIETNRVSKEESNKFPKKGTRILKYCKIDSNGKFIFFDDLDNKTEFYYDLDEIDSFILLYNTRVEIKNNSIYNELLKKYNSNKDVLSLRETYLNLIEDDDTQEYFSIEDKGTILKLNINKFTEKYPKFLRDLKKISEIVKLNRKYFQDRFLLSAFVLFGDKDYVHYYSDFRYFLVDAIDKCEEARKDNNSKIKTEFYNNLSKVIKGKNIEELKDNILASGPSFKNNILHFKYYENINIIHVLDENNNLVDRYIELPQNMDKNFFMKFMKIININITEKTRKDLKNKIIKKQVGINIIKGDKKLKEYFSTELFCHAPIVKLLKEDYEDIYKKINRIRKDTYGIRNSPRDESGKYCVKTFFDVNYGQEEEELIQIIMQEGLFGYPIKEPQDILDLKNEKNVSVIYRNLKIAKARDIYLTKLIEEHGGGYKLFSSLSAQGDS